MSFKWFYVFFFLFCPVKALGHNHNDHSHSHEHDSNMDPAKSLYEELNRLFAEGTLSAEDSLVHPYIKRKGQTIDINDTFGELGKRTRHWLRLYHREMEKEGCSCNLGPEEMVEEVQNIISQKDFFKKNKTHDKAFSRRSLDQRSYIWKTRPCSHCSR